MYSKDSSCLHWILLNFMIQNYIFFANLLMSLPIYCKTCKYHFINQCFSIKSSLFNILFTLLALNFAYFFSIVLKWKKHLFLFKKLTRNWTCFSVLNLGEYTTWNQILFLYDSTQTKWQWKYNFLKCNKILWQVMGT